MAKKHELRLLYRKKRSTLSVDSINKASAQILHHIKSQNLVQGNRVMLYVSSEKHNEISTVSWFSELKQYATCVPKIMKTGGTMEAVLWETAMPFLTNAWGIKEPKSNAYLAPETIETIIVPLLCFDKKGHRVGYGKGFYDRFLARCAPTVRTIGVSYFDPVEQIDAVETTDYPLDIVVTPTKVFRF